MERFTKYNESIIIKKCKKHNIIFITESVADSKKKQNNNIDYVVGYIFLM